LRLLEQDVRFRAAVREGIAQADREEFIEEEEMDARIERMLNSSFGDSQIGNQPRSLVTLFLNSACQLR
jgi:hypothetical protein